MICITGNEPTADALSARLLAHPGAFHEIRLDALEGSFDEALNLIGRSPRSIVCCRPRRAGGAFEGSESDRLTLLRRAAEAGAAWIDLERDALDSASQFRSSGANVLGSFHDFNAVPSDVGSIATEIASRNVDAVKIAVHISDAAELIALRDGLKALALPRVIVGMGRAGRLCRMRYRQFGSLWTYVTPSPGTATAEGQLTLEEARAAGLPESAFAPFVALIGDARIAASPGPRVYNRLFRAHGLPWSYVAVETLQPIQTLALIRELGALGTAVTIPHKKAVLSETKPDEIAERAGAANTIRFRGDTAESTNTDVIGVARPLGAAMSNVPASNALILGRGGAAAAALAACGELGLAVTTVNRALWDRRGEIAADVLINATPITDESIWPEGLPLRKKIVFDMALGPAESPLLAAARQQGALTIGPRDMWVEQGAAQMSWITGALFSSEQLRSALE